MASGHLVKLVPANASSEVPYFPEKFNITPISTKISKLNLIKYLAHRDDIDEICNACDPGREGELICYLIYKYINTNKKYTRLWANTQTPIGIRRDFENRKLEKDYKFLLESALVRTKGDFILGVNATRCLMNLMNKTEGNKSLFSAGRVKTPTIALICDLDNIIQNFIPKKFYEIHAKLKDDSNRSFQIYRKKIKNSIDFENIDSSNSEVFKNPFENEIADYKIYDKRDAELIKKICLKKPCKISYDVISKTGKEAPPQLFDITELIYSANKEFKYSVDLITKDLQELYENGLVTYPRSESKYLGEDAISHVKEILKVFAVQNPNIEIILNKNLVNKDNPVFNTQNLIDGHGAIIPEIPNSDININNFSESQKQLYQLIVDRFVTKFYPDALYEQKSYIFNINGECFEASLKNYIDLGWKNLTDTNVKDVANRVNLEFNFNKAILSEIEIVEKETTPPKRLSIGNLPKLMKHFHLGTAATRGSIINELLAAKDNHRVKYINVRKNLVYSTDEAKFVIQFLRTNNLNFITVPKLSAEWEQLLELISIGKSKSEEFMNSIYIETKKIVQTFQEQLNLIPEYKVYIGKCPKCNNDLFDTEKKLISCKCGFKIWTTIYGKNLSRDQISVLLNPTNNYTTTKLEDLKSKSGKTFAAKLKLDSEQDWKVVCIFENRNFNENKGKKTEFLCPTCGKELYLFSKELKYLQCLSNSHLFRLYLQIANRVFTKKEILCLLQDKYLSNRHGFLSKSGKNFSASLQLSPNGNVNFVFENQKKNI